MVSLMVAVVHSFQLGNAWSDDIMLTDNERKISDRPDDTEAVEFPRFTFSLFLSLFFFFLS